MIRRQRAVRPFGLSPTQPNHRARGDPMAPARVAVSLTAFLAALFSIVLAPSSAFAGPGTVSGTVTDSVGTGIPDAVVRVEGTSLRATTKASGAYEIGNVPEGRHTLLVGLIGFKPAKREIDVPADGSATADFRLEGTPIRLAPTEVVVGSRAPHSAADELAVPVDVYTSEEMAKQGTTETSQMLQTLAPSVNFPRQSVTDATDIVRPFTLRGLSPDHTLVLVDGT